MVVSFCIVYRPPVFCRRCGHPSLSFMLDSNSTPWLINTTLSPKAVVSDIKSDEVEHSILESGPSSCVKSDQRNNIRWLHFRQRSSGLSGGQRSWVPTVQSALLHFNQFVSHMTLIFRKRNLQKKPPRPKKKSLAEVVFSFSIIFVSHFKETRFLAPKTKNMKGINWQCRAESAAAPSFAPM